MGGGGCTVFRQEKAAVLLMNVSFIRVNEHQF